MHQLASGTLKAPRVSSPTLPSLASFSTSPDSKSADELILTTADIADAVKDCSSSGNATACSEDILGVVSHLSNATSLVTLAVGDCGGENDACTHDIESLAAALSNATADVSKAVVNCADSKTKVACAKDIAETSVAVAQCVVGVASAVKDCGKNATAHAY